MKMENEALCNFGVPFQDVVSVRIFFFKLAIGNCKMLFFSCLIFEGLIYIYINIHTHILHELLILG